MTETAIQQQAAPGAQRKPQEAVVRYGERGVQLHDTRDLAALALSMAFGSGKVRRGDPQPVIEAAKYAVMMAILAGAEHGLGPVASMRYIYVIDGKPAWMLDGFLTLLKRNGIIDPSDIDAWDWEMENMPDPETPLEEWPNDCCAVVRLKRKGWPRPKERRFTVGQARRIGKWGRKTAKGYETPWTTRPDRMLYARAAHDILRDFCGEALAGMSVASEAEMEAHASIASGAHDQAPALEPRTGPSLLEMASEDREADDGPIVDAEFERDPGEREPDTDDAQPETPFDEPAPDPDGGPVDIEALRATLERDVRERVGRHVASRDDAAVAEREVLQELGAIESADDHAAASARLARHPVFGDAPSPAPPVAAARGLFDGQGNNAPRRRR